MTDYVATVEEQEYRIGLEASGAVTVDGVALDIDAELRGDTGADEPLVVAAEPELWGDNQDPVLTRLRDFLREGENAAKLPIVIVPRRIDEFGRLLRDVRVGVIGEKGKLHDVLAAQKVK